MKNSAGILMFIFLSLLLLSGYKDGNTTVELSKERLDFDFKGGEASVSVAFAKKWNARTDTQWYILQADSAKSEGKQLLKMKK